MNGSNTTNQKRTSLTARLALLIGITIVAINVIQVLFVTSNAKKDIIAEYLDMYNNMIDGYALSLQNDLEGYFKELNGYVHADIMEDGNLENVYEWIMDPEHRDMHGDFDYIMLAGPEGRARTDLGGITDIRERDYFKAVMQQGKESFVDNPVIGKTTGLPVIHITRALKDKNGRTFAMISGVVNINLITEEINKIKIGDRGYGYLIASDGLVIAHPQKDFVMQKNFITGITGGENGKNGDMIKVAKAMTQRQRGSEFINANGRVGKDLIVYTPIEGTPWSFALSIPDNQIYDLVNTIRSLMFVFALVSVLLLVVISGALLITALKPLSVVEKAISGIASGDADLTRRIDIDSNNEIGYVVKGFNAFSGKLQTIISDVKASKNELSIAGEDLTASTQDTSSAITQILSNIEEIGNQITSQAAGVEETAGAVGIFDRTGRNTHLPEQRGLLVPCNAGDGYAARQQGGIGIAENFRRRTDLRQHRGRNAEKVQQLRIPRERMDIEKQRAGSIRNIGTVHFPSGQLPDQPGIDGTEAQTPRIRFFAGAGDMVQDPLDLGPGEYRIEMEIGTAEFTVSQ